MILRTTLFRVEMLSTNLDGHFDGTIVMKKLIQIIAKFLPELSQNDKSMERIVLKITSFLSKYET